MPKAGRVRLRQQPIARVSNDSGRLCNLSRNTLLVLVDGSFGREDYTVAILSSIG